MQSDCSASAVQSLLASQQPSNSVDCTMHWYVASNVLPRPASLTSVAPQPTTCSQTSPPHCAPARALLVQQPLGGNCLGSFWQVPPLPHVDTVQILLSSHWPSLVQAQVESTRRTQVLELIKFVSGSQMRSTQSGVSDWSQSPSTRQQLVRCGYRQLRNASHVLTPHAIWSAVAPASNSGQSDAVSQQLVYVSDES